MAARPESLVSPGVGPHASFVSMPPQALPPELWQLIIANLDDHCFVWFVLRRTSHLLRSVTEDLFARYVLRTCILHFAGEHARELLFLHLSKNQDLETLREDHLVPPAVAFQRVPAWDHRFQTSTFRFQPRAFVPADSKAKLVLKLCDPISDRGVVQAPVDAPPSLSGDHLVSIFFHPGPEADLYRTRLINEAHFVRFNGQLKSLRIPSLTIDIPGQQVTLDWRELCQNFLGDELKCRLNSKTLGSWSMRL